MQRNLGGLFPSNMNEYFHSPTFSLKAVDETLKKAKNSSYEYLLQHSKTMAGMERYTMTGTAIKRIYEINGEEVTPYGEFYGFTIPSSIVKVDSREAFRRSDLLNKNLTIHDISNNPDIFSHIFLVRIGSEFYPCVYVRCDDSKTYILFHRTKENAINYFLLPKILDSVMGDNSVTVEVIKIPNCEIGEMELSGPALKQALYKVVIDNFNIRSGVCKGVRNGNYMVLANIQGNYCGYNAVISEFDNTNNTITLDRGFGFRNHGEDIDPDDVNTPVRIIYFYSPYLLKPINLDENKTWFSTPIENGPISTANIIAVVKKNDNGNYSADSVANIDKYYPNKYKLNGWNVNKKKLIFIFDVDSNDRLFQSFTERYFRRVIGDNQDITKYEDGTIPDFIKNYVPPNIDFSLKAFKASTHGLGNKNDFNKYRIDKLESIIQEDGNYLSLYNEILSIERPNLIIDISTRSLTGRTRINTNPEGVYPAMVFSEPHYVFIFGKDLSPNPVYYKFFIDGISFWPKYIWYEENRTVVYFPIDIINVDTIIEIEKIYDIHSVNAGMTKGINIPNIKLKLEHRDVGYIIQKDIRYFDNGDNLIENANIGPVYSWSADENGLDEDFTMSFPDKSDGYMRLSVDQPIAALDANSTDKEITAVIDKRYGYNMFAVENDDHVTGNFEFFSIATTNPLRFRVFKNGQLLTPDKWSLVKDEDPLRPLTLIINIRKYIGDVFTIEELPYLYEMVYKKEGNIIDSTKVGLINLLLERPLDLRWYDIYINGRKLNHTHIEEMGVRKLILSKKVNSDKNIYVFQKNREPNKDIFKLSTTGPFGIDDRILDDPIFQETLPKLNDYDFTENDLFTEPIDPSNFIIRTYYKKHMVFRNINPDYKQIDQYTVDNYRALLDDNLNFLINPDQGESGAYIMPINPDQ